MLRQQQDPRGDTNPRSQGGGVGQGYERIQPVRVDGTAIRPSGAYGYGESGRSTMTTCSPDQSVENPVASATRATAPITAGSAPESIPRAWSPTRTPRLLQKQMGADRASRSIGNWPG